MILDAALDAFKQVDILVNNAGILRDKSLLKMQEEDWDAVVRVHLKGTFCVTKPIFGHMKDRGAGGVIVNTTSTAGLRGKFGQTNYGAAKAGIWGFSNSLAHEGLKYGIRVWTIAPAAASQLTDSVVSEEYKRTFTADRVAPVLLYMVSDLSGKQTGKTLLAGGGYVSEIRMEMAPGFVPAEEFGRRRSRRGNRGRACAAARARSQLRQCVRSGAQVVNESIRAHRLSVGVGFEGTGQALLLVRADTMLYALAVGMGSDPLDRKRAIVRV